MRSNGIIKPIYHCSDVPPSLGCRGCPEYDICGGLQTKEGVFNCESFCDCSQQSNCQNVCRKKLIDFIDCIHEIGGFDFDNIPHHATIPSPSLPYAVPHIYHRSKRTKPLKSEAVSISLGQLFNHRSGVIKYSSKEEIASAFGFDPTAALIINGVSEDQPIEDYWTHRLATRLPEKLANLQPALVTTPNYSLFTDVPRWNDMFSMKRIAICFSELVAAGIPTSLHLNARTDQDWKRWIDFIADHEEVTSVTFEFATGASVMKRARYHIDNLLLVADKTKHSLQLLIRGGYVHLKELTESYEDLVFVDTTSFIKTVKRKRLDWAPGQKKHWRSSFTLKGSPLDDIFQHNVDTFATMLAFHRTLSPSRVMSNNESELDARFEERQDSLFDLHHREIATSSSKSATP